MRWSESAWAPILMNRFRVRAHLTMRIARQILGLCCCLPLLSWASEKPGFEEGLFTADTTSAIVDRIGRALVLPFVAKVSTGLGETVDKI